jgi:hypothetical protein
MVDESRRIELLVSSAQSMPDRQFRITTIEAAAPVDAPLRDG